MEQKVYNAYVAILENELVPALGCTEPIAIAYAAAKAREILGKMPQAIVVNSSGNIIKNVKGVTVPNSDGLVGINVAAILGVVGGNASKELEVLADIVPEHIEQTKKLMEQDFCTCGLVEGVEGLYIWVEAKAGEDTVSVEITGKHTYITKIEKNGEVLFTQPAPDGHENPAADKDLLDVADIITFADTVRLEDVDDVINRQINFNSAIAQEGLAGSWGAQIGKTLLKHYGKEDVQIRARAAAAAGSDARMNGCAMPVVINSGSGNQGMTVSLPVVEYAREWNKSHEELIRALVLSNLIALLQKKYLGSLSAFCGAVCAATGAASGITYLHGGRYEEISKTITNTLANVGGIVCDGAKSSCAAKIASAVDAGILGFIMSTEEGNSFNSGEGLVKDNVERTIESFGRMGREGMRGTDIEILNIMLEK
ncbi:L-serine ammonia-lyase, iron-sulfur-dependent, subunit alpha [Oscillospiraceae bacterium MB08-C2-2]|nr:L-serine ammonia-lyase, iron-sulfur-dependent, subunit alpha [Oscillospiraceae bacterium MB08-C2-2]